jgi:hypothetical protein
MAFIDLGDQFIALLQKGREQRADGRRPPELYGLIL